ncbi:MAG TPA: FAD-dependent oxidoreductase [Armatimonadota bacterium]|nr:FAD-dependent oxidoreductase [Armatimonadota bacterium]
MVIGFAILAVQSAPSHPAVILVEAEAFTERGGWVVDSQFMDQMGSPFLLAHGLGRPVSDAATQVLVRAAGDYRVWVRTRDWVAPWGAPGAPGRFQVVVNGEPLGTTFGTEGAEWHWQDGGTVALPNGLTRITLHDLTGFEGRCDAIVFSADPSFVPPPEPAELAAFREAHGGVSHTVREGGHFDLVVVGGGIAGMCASLVAARHGLTVALVQDRPVLGGNNSSEVRVWLGGETGLEPYPRIGDVVRELEPKQRAQPGPAEYYEDDRRLALVGSEPNIRLLLNYRANRVRTDAGRIRFVTAQHTITGERVRLNGKWFADCTGDGTIGYLAGADYEITLQGHMGPSDMWSIADTGAPSPFPRCPWAFDLTSRPIPPKLGEWFWESGFDRDPIAEAERIRDNNLRAMYGAWDALKNVRGEYPTYRLEWAAYVAGKRESRRLMGDIVLTQEDILSNRAFVDAAVPATWMIDLHLPDPRYAQGFEGDEFISEARYTRYTPPYWVPYRCLYSRNIANLFMAGRDISVTHEALGAVRVQRTCGMMGEVVGMAASLCRKHRTSPRGVFEAHLSELQELMRRGGAGPAPR